MQQYKIFLINAESVVLDQEEFDNFRAGLVEAKLKGEDSFGIVSMSGRILMFWVGMLTHVASEEVEKESKGVIVAPTPSELRAERHQEEQKIPVTLDDQLAPFQEDNKQLV